MLAPVPPDGRPLLAHVVDTWRGAGFAEVIVVLGRDAAALRERIEEDFLRVEESRGRGDARPAATTPGAHLPHAHSPVRWIENPAWESGMFSSAQRGIAAALEGPSTHVALSPADLPFLRKSSLRTVLEELNRPEALRPRTLVVPTCGPRRGHPLVIPRELAERVGGWPADARLNRLFAERDVEVLQVPGFDDTILRDVDLPSDLAAAPEARA